MAANLMPSGKQAFTDAARNPLVGGKLYTYAAGTSAPKATWVDALQVAANTNPIILDARGEASIFWLGAYKIVLCDASDVIIWTQDNCLAIDFATIATTAALADVSGAGLIGFSNAIAYAASTMGLAMKDRGAHVTDAPYLADRTGGADAYAAFLAATTALPARGGKIGVPYGQFQLSSDPTIRTKSVFWDINLGAKFTGAGTGENKFPYMLTNFTQLAVGPYIYSYTYEKSTNPNGGTGAFNVEAVQPPDYGAGQTVAAYFGAYTNNPNVAGNIWAINTLTWVGAASAGTHHGIEIDVNNDSAAGAYVKGLSLSGAGSVDCLSAIEITRAARKWQIGIAMDKVLNGIFMSPVTGGTGITLNGAGVAAVGIGGTNLTVMQLDNGKDAILLQRITDIASSGFFIRAVNQANNTNLFSVDVSGNIVIAGTIRAGILPGPYANDAAAAAGGVIVTQFYRSGTSTVMQRVA